jgi:hypothetical protein
MVSAPVWLWADILDNNFIPNEKGLTEPVKPFYLFSAD